MEEKMNPVDSQYLLICFLKKLEPEDLMAIRQKMELDWKKVEPESKQVKDLKEYIDKCITVANEMRKHPEYCSSPDGTCKTILARQRSCKEKEIRKKDYLKEFGWTNGVQFDRTLCGKSRMQTDKIIKFCGGFSKEPDQRFWRNQLMKFFPDTSYFECGRNIESEGLNLVVKYFNEETRDHVLEGMTEAEAAQASLIFSNAAENHENEERHENAESPAMNKQGEPPSLLYSMISHMVSEKPGMTIQTLVVDEMQSTLNTWYKWKANWELANKEDFKYVPRARLQRNYILLIAVVCELNYLEAVTLLQAAGYRMNWSGQDTDVIRYFLNREGDVEAIKRRLRQ